MDYDIFDPEIGKSRIELTVDLPVSRKHGCRKGRQYNLVSIYRHKKKGTSSTGRTVKVEFYGDVGEKVCALPGEFRWI